MARYLWFGCKGSDVQQAQRALNANAGLNDERLVEDGHFGQRTRLRVIAFQKARGLEPDGIIGPLTGAALGIKMDAPPYSTRPPQQAKVAPHPDVMPANQINDDPVLRAVSRGLLSWKQSASLVGVQVRGIIASGGYLTGPPILIRCAPGSLDVSSAKSLVAISTAARNAFMSWQATVKVPGLPWYPTFSAVAAPITPPTPNLPTPLSQISGRRLDEIFVREIRGELGSGFAGDAAEKSSFHARVAGSTAMISAMFYSCMVRNIIAIGRVDGYFPPHSPIGTVSRGEASGSPGCLK